MAYDYDPLYRTTPDALGAPDPTLIAMLTDHLAPPARVLDIGCGQGRDAIALARRGYSVTGVDLSPSGIAALDAAGARDALPITGIVADITTFQPEAQTDALLFDRSLHMLDAGTRKAGLARLLWAVRPGGWCLIADEPGNMAGLRAVIERAPGLWTPIVSQRNRLLAQRGPD